MVSWMAENAGQKNDSPNKLGPHNFMNNVTDISEFVAGQSELRRGIL